MTWVESTMQGTVLAPLVRVDTVRVWLSPHVHFFGYGLQVSVRDEF